MWSCTDCEGVNVPSVDPMMINCVKQKKVTLEDIMLKLNGMGSKYNILLEKFLKQDIDYRTLKTELFGVKKELGEIKNKKDNTVDSEEIISEIMDRSSRSYNVMIFNLLELGDPVLNTRIKHDKDSIANILRPANVSDNEVVRVLRMGKRGVKNRLAKVVFPNPEAARSVLRSRSVILENCSHKISINADQTTSHEYTSRIFVIGLINVDRRVKMIFLLNSSVETYYYI
ncbi:hypothetical protein WA026_021019 [Henosepilachna vigintioctopunctata]|uniref:Uncharacterized protein n=1 Tax=Henosepilachna vigintioctopunctata TaxID=420089 RepID=A0AAW1VHK8_9CUCU